MAHVRRVRRLHASPRTPETLNASDKSHVWIHIDQYGLLLNFLILVFFQASSASSGRPSPLVPSFTTSNAARSLLPLMVASFRQNGATLYAREAERRLHLAVTLAGCIHANCLISRW